MELIFEYGAMRAVYSRTAAVRPLRRCRVSTYNIPKLQYIQKPCLTTFFWIIYSFKSL